MPWQYIPIASKYASELRPQSKKSAARGKERVLVAQLAKEPEESNHEIATKSMPGADIAHTANRKKGRNSSKMNP